MINRAPFGATGHESTRTIFGAAALWTDDAAQADRTLEVILEYGINHIDTAASYGESELMVGRWMGRHREQFFLATKTGERSYDAAKEQFHRSLDRLRVDHVDLLQMHCLVAPEEWDRAMAPGGAIEALIEAQETGLTRFVGVTGHGLQVADMHVKSLEFYPFDSVLLPYNRPLMQLADYAASFEDLSTMCRERKVAMQTIKAIARRPKPEDGTGYTTWYEPLMNQEDIDVAVHWVLGRSNVFLNTAGDVDLLPRVLDAASRFDKENVPTDTEMDAWIKSRGLARIFPAPFE